jgi:Flp pilus assembly protein TadG
MTPPATAPVSPASPAPTLSRAARLRHLRRRLRADDRGLITPWTAIGTLMVILLAGLVFDAGMAMADQVRLYDRAQAAARAGAREIDLATYRGSGVIQLDPDAAVSAAEGFLAQSGTTATATATTDTVTVVVTGVRQTQLLYLIGVTTIPIDATATATAATGVTAAN